jgi:Flp pilus assembly protein TadD
LSFYFNRLLAQAILKLVPEEPEGHIYTANTLQELGRNEEAYGVLVEAATKFPDDEIITYDLACVLCALGRTAEARNWLAKAIDLGGDEIKLRALDDSDLEPTWKDIGQS